MGVLWVYSGCVMVVSWMQSGCIMGVYRVYHGNKMGVFWVHSACRMACNGHVQSVFWMLGAFWTYSGRIWDACSGCTKCITGVLWLYSGYKLCEWWVYNGFTVGGSCVSNGCNVGV